jgi:hypothetical protein
MERNLIKSLYSGNPDVIGLHSHDIHVLPFRCPGDPTIELSQSLSHLDSLIDF